MTTRNIVLLVVGSIVVIGGIATLVTVRNRRRLSREKAAEEASAEVKTEIKDEKIAMKEAAATASAEPVIPEEWRHLFVAPKKESKDALEKRMDAIVAFAEAKKHAA